MHADSIPLVDYFVLLFSRADAQCLVAILEKIADEKKRRRTIKIFGSFD
ncbi:MAG: hypothetical protein WHT06_05555 [Desulfobacterales bacterium]